MFNSHRTILLQCHLCDVSKWNPNIPDWDHALSCISDPAAVERIMRYHKGHSSSIHFPRHTHPDTKCFAIGRLLLQQLVARAETRNNKDEVQGSSVNPRHVQLGKTAEGKPFPNSPFLLRSGWNVNMSHAGSLVVAVEIDDIDTKKQIASDYGGIVGIDVMPVELVPPQRRGLSEADVDEFLSCFRSYYTAAEWAWIEKNSSPIANSNNTTKSPAQPVVVLMRFYVIWTLKEAYIKAVGIGLGFELQRAEFTFAGDADVTNDDLFSHFDDDTSSEGPKLEEGDAQKMRMKPSVVSLAIDGVPQKDRWNFYCFTYPGGDDEGGGISVGAIALGPYEDAKVSSFGDVVAVRESQTSAQQQPISSIAVRLSQVSAQTIVQAHSPLVSSS